MCVLVYLFRICQEGYLLIKLIHSFMAPCLPDDLVKAFAKQMNFYNVYQARIGSAAHNRKPSFWWTLQMRVLIFPWKGSLETGSSGLCGVSVVSSGPQAASVILFSHSEQGAEPFMPNTPVQDGCSATRITFLFQAGERRPRGDKTLVVAKSSPSKSSPRGSIK